MEPIIRVRVLCVDDNRDVADSEVLLLNSEGFDAVACYGGEAALALARTFCPDACLVDLNMPGLDGCEVARRLKAEHCGTPPFLIAVTARSGAGVLHRTSEAGFDGHLVKPVEPALLLEILSRVDAMVNVLHSEVRPRVDRS